MVQDDLKYTKEHEWVRVEGDEATVGITDFAQQQLGDIVYVELPSPGAKVEFMKAFGTVEAVKAVSDLYSPVTGEVTSVNSDLSADPAVIKASPYDKGWLIKVKLSDKQELAKLMTAAAYRQVIGE
ncbi:MAG TPA: glycine cleavage system protein GcvH [bacterium]|nr:glycine cleavage system protein GcvH [bacterium]